MNQYQRVKTFFDKDSTQYLKQRYGNDACNPYTTMYNVRKKIVLNMIDSVPGLWLDVGCGPGPLIPDLLRKGLRVVGADLSLDMVKVASKNLRAQGLNGAYFSANNVDCLGFRDNSFDGVIAIGVFSYTPSIEATLREIYRILKPKGIAILQISNQMSLPEAETRFVVPLWNFLKTKWSSSEGKKVHFSWNPFNEFDLNVRAHNTRQLESLCHLNGFKKIVSEYYDFRFPLVWKILPRLSINLSTFLSNSKKSKYYSILASGYILKVEKVTES